MVSELQSKIIGYYQNIALLKQERTYLLHHKPRFKKIENSIEKINSFMLHRLQFPYLLPIYFKLNGI